VNEEVSIDEHRRDFLKQMTTLAAAGMPIVAVAERGFWPVLGAQTKIGTVEALLAAATIRRLVRRVPRGRSLPVPSR